MIIDTELWELAVLVREEAEALVKSGRPGPCCGRDLAGACGDVSAAFVAVAGLPETCYESGEYDFYGHCWVRMPDGQIWDLTATQFSIADRVYLPTDTSKYATDKIGGKALRELELWGDAEWRDLLIERVRSRQQRTLGRAA